jgi:hypothetical protein
MHIFEYVAQFLKNPYGCASKYCARERCPLYIDDGNCHREHAAALLVKVARQIEEHHEDIAQRIALYGMGAELEKRFWKAQEKNDDKG